MQLEAELMNKHFAYLSLGLLIAVFGLTTLSQGGTIAVPNHNFETIPPDPNLDADNNYETGDIRPPWRHDNTTAANRIYDNTETWTDPSTYFAGWANTGAQSTAGRYGLQQPASNYFARTTGGQFDPLNSPFDGNFIGFINLDDPDLFTGYAQSAILGELKSGTYELTVAIGARGNATWNDVRYSISLVADPTVSGPGTTAGAVVGTPATATLVPATAMSGSNTQDLTYTVFIDPANPLIGHDYAIRIQADNMLVENGVLDPDDGDRQFTQGNFDNVRLQFVPEPGAVAIALSSVVGLCFAARRRR
jgi:hypothetical protein